MNNITIAGAVGRNAEVRHTQTGDPVAGFSVAVNEGKDRTTWFNCSLRGDRAIKLAPYITKGSKITVSGPVSARVHEGKAYLQVFVNQFTLQGGGERREQAQQQAPADALDGDSIPF